jgi:hypothetical protein
MSSSIQSMPRVAATPMAAASSVPTMAAAMPIRMVSQMGMACRPVSARCHQDTFWAALGGGTSR